MSATTKKIRPEASLAAAKKRNQERLEREHAKGRK
jgi:hypothetical protein